MDLDFSEEQDMLREAVRGLCNDKASLESVRELENDATGYDPEFWAQLGDLGIAGALIDEEHGGSGMSMLDATVVYEEIGRSLAPSPHFVSAVVAAGVLSRAGSDAQCAEWLPAIASTRAILTPAWLEPDNSSAETGVQMRAVTNGDTVTLNGAKRHVFFASSADRLVVLARTDAGVELFLVDPKSDGVGLAQQLSVASDAQYRVDFDNVTVPVSDRIGEAGSGWATWHDTLLDAAVLVAAQSIGGAQRTHEITCEYAKQREQFGKPIAAFQAISHYLADGVTEIDGGRVLVHQAAWARDDGRSIEKLAPMAKLFATKVFREVTSTSIQVHGGMGFTVECDAQLFFRRAKSLELNWWDSSVLEELIAAQVLD